MSRSEGKKSPTHPDTDRFYKLSKYKVSINYLIQSLPNLVLEVPPMTQAAAIKNQARHSFCYILVRGMSGGVNCVVSISKSGLLIRA